MKRTLVLVSFLIALTTPVESKAKDLCFAIPSLNPNLYVISGVRRIKPSRTGRMYQVHGRIALAGGFCNGSNAVGLFGTAVVTADGKYLRLFLTQPGLPRPCVPGWMRFDIDAKTMTGTWNVNNPDTGKFSGADLTPIDCRQIPPPS